MTGKDICSEITRRTGVKIDTRHLYQKLCDIGLMRRREVRNPYESANVPVTPGYGISLVLDPGIPYERPDFNQTIVDLILSKYAGLQPITSEEDIIRIIDSPYDAPLSPSQTSRIRCYRNDFRNHYGKTIHNYYLSSKRWYHKRDRALLHYGDKCGRCGYLPTINRIIVGEYISVHHLTYMNWLDELLEELIPLCSKCHTWIHTHWDNNPSRTPYVKRFTDGLRLLRRDLILQSGNGVRDEPH